MGGLVGGWVGADLPPELSKRAERQVDPAHVPVKSLLTDKDRGSSANIKLENAGLHANRMREIAKCRIRRALVSN